MSDDLNTVGLLRRPFLRLTASTNVKYSVLSITAELFHELYSRVCDHHEWFSNAVVSPTVNLRVQISQNNRFISRDFGDIPIISIFGNIRLQCKQRALGYPIGANS